MLPAYPLRAAWLWTGEGLPLRGASLRWIGAKGWRLETQSNADSIDLGDYCLLPGLINSHTHLEFSDLKQPIPASGTFADWLARVVRQRREASPSDRSKPDAISQGIDESERAGVTVALNVFHPTGNPDRSSSVGSTDDSAVGCRLLCMDFAELIGTTPEREAETWAAAIDRSRRLPPGQFGLSPHAPYTTTMSLVERAVERCQQAHWPIMMHLAESIDERQWLEDGKGPLPSLMEQAVGPAWRSTRERGTMADYAASLCRAPATWIVHGNYLDEASLDILSRRAATHPDSVAIVYCPRTHLHFGHRPYPLLDYLQRGIPIVLGTDSRASNPDLSILEEARLVRKLYPALSANAIIAMITTTPRRMLDRLEVASRGRSIAAGWTIVPCHARRPEDVLESILADHASPRILTQDSSSLEEERR